MGTGCGCGEEGAWGVSTGGQGPGKDSLPKSTGEPLQNFKQERFNLTLIFEAEFLNLESKTTLH